MAVKTTVKTKGKKAKVAEVVVDAKPIDHVLVPKVEIADQADLKNLMDNFNISIAKLPLIKSTDSAIAFLKLNPGSVVKFHRTSLVTGDNIDYYRLVIGGE